jgi:hypothetical protein
MSAWWLLVMGAGLLSVAVCGWVYEYYIGEHAH